LSQHEYIELGRKRAPTLKEMKVES